MAEAKKRQFGSGVIGMIQEYRTFDEGQKKFLRNHLIDDKLSVRNWIRMLEPLCRFDEKVDGFFKKMYFYVFLSVVFFIGSWIAMANFTTEIWSGVLAGMAMCCALAAFIFLVYWIRTLSKHDMNDNIRKVLFPLLHILSLEVGNRQRIQVKMNFDKKTSAESKVKTEGPSDPRNIDEEIHDYEILELHTRFIDGTQLVWKVVDRVFDFKRRNPRGKIKFKVKLKRQVLCQLKFDRKWYDLKCPIESIPRDMGKFKLDESSIKAVTFFKQKAKSRYAEMPMNDLMKCMKTPYLYLVKKGEAA